MIVDTDRVNEVAMALLGSTSTLEGYLTEKELNDIEFLRELDFEVHLCDRCGWWCETSETDDRGFCADCQEDEED